MRNTRIEDEIRRKLSSVQATDNEKLRALRAIIKELANGNV